jgi:hypothetical protein
MTQIAVHSKSKFYKEIVLRILLFFVKMSQIDKLLIGDIKHVLEFVKELQLEKMGIKARE